MDRAKFTRVSPKHEYGDGRVLIVIGGLFDLVKPEVSAELYLNKATCAPCDRSGRSGALDLEPCEVMKDICKSGRR